MCQRDYCKISQHISYNTLTHIQTDRHNIRKNFRDHATGTIYLYNISALCNTMEELCDMRTALWYMGALW